MTTTTYDPANADALLAAAGQHVCMISLYCGWPKLQYLIDEAVVEIETADGKQVVDKNDRSNPQWKLCPEAWRKRMVKLEGKCRAVVNSHSVSFPIKGMRPVPYSRVEDVFRQLNQLREEFDQLRDEFVSGYSTIMLDLQAKLSPEAFERAKKKMPDASNVASKFRLEWPTVPMGGSATGLSAEVIQLLTDVQAFAGETFMVNMRENVRERIEQLSETAGRLLRENRQFRPAGVEDVQNLLAESRQMMHEYAARFVESMAVEPRQELANAVDHITEAVASGRRIMQSSIDNVREARDRIRSFEFLADEELLRRLNDVDQVLDGVTCTDVNTDAAIGARIATGLRQVANEARDLTRASVAVRRFRQVHVPAPSPEPQPA